MTTASIARHATTPWMRRLLRTRADRIQGIWSVVLVLATMVACVWIATPDFAAGIEEAAGTPPAVAPRG